MNTEHLVRARPFISSSADRSGNIYRYEQYRPTGEHPGQHTTLTLNEANVILISNHPAWLSLRGLSADHGSATILNLPRKSVATTDGVHYSEMRVGLLVTHDDVWELHFSMPRRSHLTLITEDGQSVTLRQPEPKSDGASFVILELPDQGCSSGVRTLHVPLPELYRALIPVSGQDGHIRVGNTHITVQPECLSLSEVPLSWPHERPGPMPGPQVALPLSTSRLTRIFEVLATPPWRRSTKGAP